MQKVLTAEVILSLIFSPIFQTLISELSSLFFMAVNRSREAWKTYGNVFDNFTIRNLEKLSSQGYFEELKGAIALGKEANVFSATTKEGSLVAVKIYRLESCNFNKMYEYISQDQRYIHIKGQKRRIIFAWTQREYRNLLKAREHIQVPSPHVFKDNIIVMDFVGGDEPAPKLKDVHLEDPKRVFEEIIEEIERLFLDANLVHGDLSEYNILYHNDYPIFIDLSQSTAADSPSAIKLLERDLSVICNFFKKRGLKEDPEKIFNSFLEKRRLRQEEHLRNLKRAEKEKFNL